jgi:RNA ligase
MFPKNIAFLDHLRDNEMIKFKTEVVNGEEVTIVCYSIANAELWDIENAKECRGIVFDSTGKCICAPLEKFHNVGERESTLPENLPWDSYARCEEKRDGSMLTPVLINGKVFWKTKKSFTSGVALEAAANAPENVTEMSYTLLRNGLTPIFEYTSPTCEIVINYGQAPKFTLLAVRDQEEGFYARDDALKAYARTYGVECIRSFHLTYNEMQDQMSFLKNFEGYVLVFGHGADAFLRAKMKTDDYLRLHRCKTELRYRDIADFVIEETLDDIKSALTQAGLSLASVEEIEGQVAHELAMLEAEVDNLAKEVVGWDRKSVALRYKDHCLFGLLMDKYSGKEPRLKSYWKKHCRDSYSLNTVYSNFKSEDNGQTE